MELNLDHSVVEPLLLYWRNQYPETIADDIENEVRNIYGEIAVSKIAHSEQLRGVIPTKVIDEDMRSDHALTMSLLGLIAEEAVITNRLTKYRRKAVAA